MSFVPQVKHSCFQADIVSCGTQLTPVGGPNLPSPCSFEGSVFLNEFAPPRNRWPGPSKHLVPAASSMSEVEDVPGGHKPQETASARWSTRSPVLSTRPKPRGTNLQIGAVPNLQSSSCPLAPIDSISLHSPGSTLRFLKARQYIKKKKRNSLRPAVKHLQATSYLESVRENSRSMSCHPGIDA